MRPVNRLVMLRARGLSGPFFQNVGGGRHVHTAGNFIGSIGGLLFPHIASPGGFAGEGDWLTATAYTEGDLVANDGRYFVASSDHTSGATTEPGVGAGWEDSWTEVKLYSSASEAFATPSRFDAAVKEGATVAQTFDLYLQSVDASGSALSWTLVEDTGSAWLEVSAGSGAGPMAWATVTVDPTGLADGEYTDALVFAAVGASESPITIPVTLTVVPEGELVMLESGDGFVLTEDEGFVQTEGIA